MYHTQPVNITFLRHFAGGERREMIKDILEKTKKEMTEVLISDRGGCKFCGQIAALEVPTDWTEEMCNELATELCECVEAQSYSRKKKQKEKAAEAIEEQFGEKAESKVEEKVAGLLIDIADAVIEEKINSGSLDIGNGMKAKIAITAKGLVKVERTVTEKGAKEV